MSQATVRRTERTTAKRFPRRTSHDRAALYQVLDATLIPHVGFVHEGTPAVLPMAFWRDGDHVYFHGNYYNRMLGDLRERGECCFVATSLDGLVLARRAMHHSLNYRSVVIIGRPQELTALDDKRAAMRAFVERMYPGRWAEILTPTDAELAKLSVMRLAIDEASVKSREGHPLPVDGEVAAWAGYVPIRLAVGTPVPDEMTATAPLPDYLERIASLRLFQPPSTAPLP